MRGYCDAAYGVIMRQHMRDGLSLQEGIDRLAEWAADVTKSLEERQQEAIARQNDAEMRKLQAMFGGAF